MRKPQWPQTPEGEAEILHYPNVIGVAYGVRTRRGKPTGEPCLVVYVSVKVPPAELRREDLLPAEVDVVEVGQLSAL